MSLSSFILPTGITDACHHAWLFFRQGLSVLPRPVLNLCSSCLSLLESPELEVCATGPSLEIRRGIEFKPLICSQHSILAVCNCGWAENGFQKNKKTCLSNEMFGY